MVEWVVVAAEVILAVVLAGAWIVLGEWLWHRYELPRAGDREEEW